MKVCGFTFVRNGILYDYPFLESIQSLLPICDKVLVSVGNSDDETRRAIHLLDSPKIEIMDSIWDDSLRENGRVLAIETDKAFQAIPSAFDWAIYLQADEVIHEQALPEIKKAMELHYHNPAVEGFLLKYLHFYGSYDYVAEAYSWCRQEVRVIRNDKNIFSYKDAQGFRKKPNQKLKVKLVEGFIYHYSYVRNPYRLKNKLTKFHSYWHTNEWIEKNLHHDPKFDFGETEILNRFEGSHPEVMSNRIKNMDWTYERDLRTQRIPMIHRVRKLVENLTGWRMGEYRNYKLVK